MQRKQQHQIKCIIISMIVALMTAIQLWMPQSAIAALEDDQYDGNIFALYAGNGSLVPARVTLEESMQTETPTLLVFYLDDSKDCKAFSVTVSELQRYYGRAASFIPINVDQLAGKEEFSRTEPGYYYRGLVPQTVLIDGDGKVVFDQVGQVSFETLDDEFREVFDLLPRSESEQRKRRPVNDLNVELRE